MLTHTELTVQLYDHLQHRCTDEEVHKIVSEAVVLEKEFLIDALPCSLIGINADVRSHFSYAIIKLTR